jgi:hypothetical protein
MRRKHLCYVNIRVGDLGLLYKNDASSCNYITVPCIHCPVLVHSRDMSCHAYPSVISGSTVDRPDEHSTADLRESVVRRPLTGSVVELAYAVLSGLQHSQMYMGVVLQVHSLLLGVRRPLLMLQPIVDETFEVLTNLTSVVCSLLEVRVSIIQVCAALSHPAST